MKRKSKGKKNPKKMVMLILKSQNNRGSIVQFSEIKGPIDKLTK